MKSGRSPKILILKTICTMVLMIIPFLGNTQTIIDDFTAQVKAGNAQQGFIDCIERCGQLLQEFVPASHEKNELPNHLVVI